MKRTAGFAAAIAAAALVAGCASSAPSGDARACEMVKQELGQKAGQFATAEAVAVSPGLRQQISYLAYAVSIEDQPYPLGSAGLVEASAAVTQISGICSDDGVSGISQA